MFRTFALVVGLVAAFGAFGYAQNLRGYQALNVKNPRAAAGQVNSDGTVAQGTHFTVTRINTGNYEIIFNERYFDNGCPMLTVAPIEKANSFMVIQSRCRVWYANFSEPGGGRADTSFSLIAVAAQ